MSNATWVILATLVATLCAATYAAPFSLDMSSLSNAWNEAGVSSYKCKSAFKDFGKAVADANAESAARRTKLDTTARVYLKQQMENAQADGDLDKVLVFKTALESARGGEIAGDDEAIVKLRESYEKQLALVDRTLLEAGLGADHVLYATLDWQKSETTKKGDIVEAQKIAAFQKKVAEWSKSMTKHIASAAAQSAPVVPSAPSRHQPQSARTVKQDSGACYDNAGSVSNAVRVIPARTAANSTPSEAHGGQLLHRWSFNGNLKDSVGGQAARAMGKVTSEGKSYRLHGGNNGSSYIDLGPGVLPRDGRGATIEIWATRHSLGSRGSHSWSRVLDFGSNTRKETHIVMSWDARRSINNDYGRAHAGVIANGLEYHIALVFNPQENGTWFITEYWQNAASGDVVINETGSLKNRRWSLEQQAMDSCFLGHSRYREEDAFASYNEVRVWAIALTGEQLAESARRGPDAIIPSGGAASTSRGW